MVEVQAIIYRYLTDADFFNINKPKDSEEGGGGQSYIDFPITDISVAEWRAFFANVQNCIESRGTKGPVWEFPIYGLNLSGIGSQRVKIFQRRDASVSITAQKLFSKKSNRVFAWHPTYGFPAPQDPTNRNQLPSGLSIYLVKTSEYKIIAGWLLSRDESSYPTTSPDALHSISEMISPDNRPGDAGIIKFVPGQLVLSSGPGGAIEMLPKGGIYKDATKIKKAARKVVSKNSNEGRPRGYSEAQRSEAEIIKSLFSEDALPNQDSTSMVKTVAVFVRNRKAVNDLKALYQHQCQITGKRYLFKKKDGQNYTEAHHLVPLGQGGADSPLNMVILSPLVHKMLHHANVEGITLENIEAHDDGSAVLDIKINGEAYTIKWKKSHYEAIMKNAKSSDVD